MEGMHVTVDSDEAYCYPTAQGEKRETIPENGLLLVNPSEAFECLRRLKKTAARPAFFLTPDMVVTG